MPFIAAWFQLEIIILSEVNQKEKDKYHMISLMCMWILKSDTNEPIYETETDSWTYRTDLWLPRKGRQGEESLGSLGLADANFHIHDG